MLNRRVTWLTAAGALAAAGLLRAAHGYRPFPSIDDFTYLPMALARLDPHLYPRDVLLRETPLHVPFLPPLVAILQPTTGLDFGFWLITIVLSVLTIVAMYRWMRAIGLPGMFLPVAATLACAGWVEGLGRGEYDGLFGNAFHFQWAALCALIWAYDGLIRARWVQAGGPLVLALLFHPVVGAHGMFAMACGLAFASGSSTRARAWLVPAAVGTCATLGLLVSFPLSRPSVRVFADLPEVAHDLLFRLPQEYEIHRLQAILLVLLVAAGILGVVRLRRPTSDASVATLLGLTTGHMLLLVAAYVLYESHSLSLWSRWTVLPFQLSLTRTTPILLALSGVSAAVGLEAGFLRAPAGGNSLRGFAWLVTAGIQVAAVLCLAIFQVRWSWQVATCCGVAALTAVAIRRETGYRTLTAVWLVALVFGLGLFARSAPLSGRVDGNQEQLFGWARSKTSLDALFIVPPGFQEFRVYSRRSVYVDFKTVTPGDPRLVRLWRERLEQVAAPDRLAREARGWEGIPEWDRTYAGRNTPARIESLLRETGADYFVWDRQGLQIPPFVDRDRAPDPALAIAFENARYEVYRLVR
jgi:Domain of unknown function (DUF6798)